MGRRAGRKRKLGKRHPGGQLVAKPTSEVRLDLRTRTSRQPHRRGLKAEDRMDERGESPLGRLFLRRLIGQDAYDAGSRYAAVVGAYRAVVEGPRQMKCTLGAIAARDRAGDDETDGGERRGCIAEETGSALACKLYPEDCSCLRRKERYDGAFEALLGVSRAALMAVNRIAVQGAEPMPGEIVNLVAGLDELAQHFGLTAPKRRSHYDNAR